MTQQHKQHKEHPQQTKTLVLLPGFDGTGKLFARLIDSINALCEADAFDIRVVSYTNEVELNDYVQTVRKLIGDETVTLLAESFSGPIAIQLLSQYPEIIERCIFSTSFAETPYLSLCNKAMQLPNIMFTNQIMRQMAMKQFCYGRHFTASLGKETLKTVQKLPVSIIKQRLTLLSKQDSQTLVSSIKTPCLYLQASDDKIVTAALSEKLHSILPNVRVHEIEGPHLLLQAKPADCAAAIIAFCNEMAHETA